MTRLLAATAVLALLETTAVASDTIRVALVENARVAEFRGVDIEVRELGGCPTCPRRAWRADSVKAVATGQGVEIDGRSATGFRLTSDSPIRLNGREYPAALEVVRTGDALTIFSIIIFVVFIGIIVWDCAWAARPIQLALGNGTRSGLVALDRAGKH